MTIFFTFLASNSRFILDGSYRIYLIDLNTLESSSFFAFDKFLCLLSLLNLYFSLFALYNSESIFLTSVLESLFYRILSFISWRMEICFSGSETISFEETLFSFGYLEFCALFSEGRFWSCGVKWDLFLCFLRIPLLT